MKNNTYPKLHNAMWPGLVGKGEEEPPISLDKMLEMTAKAEVNGVKFDGVDLFLADPHTSIDTDDDGIKALAQNVGERGLKIGSAVAPVWPPVGGGSAMDEGDGRTAFLEAVKQACRIMGRLRELGVRDSGVIRVDTATDVASWAKNPASNTAKIAETMQQACIIAEDHGERLAAEGEICWGGMHSWKHMVELLESVGRPDIFGFQADLAHTMLYALGYNAPEHRLLPENHDWKDPTKLDEALKTITDALRPWTIDFHVAQNDGTVHGSGSHDKTGRHCLATDPDGKLDVVKHAGLWLNNADGTPTKAIQHICWDGCMFPNAVLEKQQTWNDILATMIKVRDAHGWQE
ncbi:MAG TPA: xylose isomerase [Rhodobacteraceae bacterium]|nr:sugar phosphate isomerase/epimerase [Alphaproteobacteria bacterium]HAB38756.1 xylose isomerase [Paracoccaceae bacterium]